MLEEGNAVKEPVNFKNDAEHFTALPPKPCEEEPASTM
jgi:hypothetical protein